MSDTTGRGPLQSKKFVAFLVSDLTLKVLAVLILAWAWNLDEVSTRVFFLLLAVIVVTGFLAVGYILGQAGLDRYVRLAQIAVQGAANGKTNGSLNKVLAKGTKGMIQAHDDVLPPPKAEEPEEEGEER